MRGKEGRIVLHWLLVHLSQHPSTIKRVSTSCQLVFNEFIGLRSSEKCSTTQRNRIGTFLRLAKDDYNNNMRTMLILQINSEEVTVQIGG